MDNWRAEAERFYPGLRVRLWRGEPAAELSAAREEADLIVINYAQLRSLSPEIAQCALAGGDSGRGAIHQEPRFANRAGRPRA